MTRLSHRSRMTACLALVTCASIMSCRSGPESRTPTIEFTHIPPAGNGTPDKLESIAGRVSGALPGERIVLFALSGVWWVQPTETRPYTTIQTNSSWNGSTHPGSQYAALLVDAAYRPPMTSSTLPAKGGLVRAVAVVSGGPAKDAPTLQFSGYQWEIQGGEIQGPAGPSNAWTDGDGSLHLRVSKFKEHWAGGEVRLSRSLGFGSYKFLVRDVSRLEPAAVFALFTWDELGPPREMDIEVSRWGEPRDRNAQYVIQPYVVPSNTVRFDAPAGPLSYWMDWEPGRVTFKTTRGGTSNVVAQHVFTSGVPAPGGERIHINAYAYGNRLYPLQHEFEVVIEKFEFLP